MVDAFNEWRIVTEEYPSVAKWERKLFRGFQAFDEMSNLLISDETLLGIGDQRLLSMMPVLFDGDLTDYFPAEEEILTSEGIVSPSVIAVLDHCAVAIYWFPKTDSHITEVILREQLLGTKRVGMRRRGRPLTGVVWAYKLEGSMACETFLACEALPGTVAARFLDSLGNFHQFPSEFIFEMQADSADDMHVDRDEPVFIDSNSPFESTSTFRDGRRPTLEGAVASSESTVFCRGCGQGLGSTATMCPSCGATTDIAKDKSIALLLAIFLGFWTWVYTYQRDKVKFWTALGISVLGALLLVIFIGVFVILGVTIWAIIDVAVKPPEFYRRYPQG